MYVLSFHQPRVLLEIIYIDKPRLFSIVITFVILHFLLLFYYYFPVIY